MSLYDCIATPARKRKHRRGPAQAPPTPRAIRRRTKLPATGENARTRLGTHGPTSLIKKQVSRLLAHTHRSSHEAVQPPPPFAAACLAGKPRRADGAPPLVRPLPWRHGQIDQSRSGAALAYGGHHFGHKEGGRGEAAGRAAVMAEERGEITRPSRRRRRRRKQRGGRGCLLRGRKKWPPPFGVLTNCLTIGPAEGRVW